MSEQVTCHEWNEADVWGPGYWLVEADQTTQDEYTHYKLTSGYCTVCGDRLNSDGTVTQMVAAPTLHSYSILEEILAAKIVTLAQRLQVSNAPGFCDNFCPGKCRPEVVDQHGDCVRIVLSAVAKKAMRAAEEATK